MARSIRDNAKKKRGRPRSTGTGQLIGVRRLPPLLDALDKFIADENDDQSSRPHAIRLILDDWLKLHSYLKVTVDKKALPKAK